tara:strand:- start:2891 stop:3022 length:132 start_codon:yes stop_codon:yes gene_type:complete
MEVKTPSPNKYIWQVGMNSTTAKLLPIYKASAQPSLDVTLLKN